MRERVKILLADFEQATNNLKTALETAKTDLEIDGTVKRFELCYELSWKLIKAYLEDVGIVCKNPKDCFKYAVENGLIENENIWMEMIDDRNLLVHTYSSEDSREIFENIKDKYLDLFLHLIKTIKKE